MGRLKVIRDLVEWASTVFTVIGWLGLSAGLAVFLAGAASWTWAIVTGIPASILILAGLCVAIAAVYASMIPTAFRVMSLVLKAAESNRLSDKHPPEYAVWRTVDRMTIKQAAALWSECDPNARPTEGDRVKIETRLVALLAAARRRDIETVGQFYSDGSGLITRDSLVAYARELGELPKFLK